MTKSNRHNLDFKMMIFRFLLPLVFCGTACTAFVSVAGQPASRDLQGDALFDWDIQSIEGYPTATFTSESINNEIEFGYEFAGELTDEKYLTVDLRQTDCITPADDLALVAFDYVGGQYLWVDVDVIQETIESSVLTTKPTRLLPRLPPLHRPESINNEFDFGYEFEGEPGDERHFTVAYE
jgi:hypothetical protein